MLDDIMQTGTGIIVAEAGSIRLMLITGTLMMRGTMISGTVMVHRAIIVAGNILVCRTVMLCGAVVVCRTVGVCGMPQGPMGWGPPSPIATSPHPAKDQDIFFFNLPSFLGTFLSNFFFSRL